MQKQRLTLVERIVQFFLRLFQKRALVRVYTHITVPGSGAGIGQGQQTIAFEFGTTVAGIIYCLQIFREPDYDTPIQSIQLAVDSTTYSLDILIAADTGYMFRIVPCDPGGMIVVAGSIGISSAIID